MTTSFVVVMQLTFASDIFVHLETMPGWLPAAVGCNPVTYLANASRALMHGRPAGEAVPWTLAASAVIVLLASPIAMRLYRKER